jgi:hypothetical protein
MAGETTEVINSQEAILKVGADIYIMIQDMNLSISRPESREPTTDGGVFYFYGKGDHFFTFTILATTPELDALNTLTELNANGVLTSTAWVIQYKDVSGTWKEFATTGVLPSLSISSVVENGVKCQGRVRITSDTIAVTSSP